MAKHHDKSAPEPQAAETVENSIVRRRRLLKRAALLGIPAMLTLSGQAFAGGSGRWGSGAMSGNMSN